MDSDALRSGSSTPAASADVLPEASGIWVPSDATGNFQLAADADHDGSGWEPLLDTSGDMLPLIVPLPAVAADGRLSAHDCFWGSSRCTSPAAGASDTTVGSVFDDIQLRTMHAAAAADASCCASTSLPGHLPASSGSTSPREPEAMRAACSQQLAAHSSPRAGWQVTHPHVARHPAAVRQPASPASPPALPVNQAETSPLDVPRTVPISNSPFSAANGIQDAEGARRHTPTSSSSGGSRGGGEPGVASLDSAFDDDEFETTRYCVNCTGSLDSDLCMDCGHLPEADESLFDTFAAPAFGASNEEAARLPRLPLGDTVLIWDERMELHQEAEDCYGSPHPERPDRLRAVMARLLASGLAERCQRKEARPATAQEIQTCHTPALLHTVEATAVPETAGIVNFTADTYTNRHTSLCASLAAGASVDAALAVVSGKARSAAAIVRPPGHHAESGMAMGFCFYNNAAIAARAARQAGAERVLILDWDVHHGNGTAHILDEDPSIMYMSLHRYDGGSFYPGTGAAHEVGIGEGRGYTVNVAWSGPGMGDADYLAAFHHVLLPISSQFAPNLIIVSAGFDAAEGDPIGGCEVTPAGFAAMTGLLGSVAPLALILEGGYNLTATAAGVEACMRVCLGEAPPLVRNADGTALCGASAAGMAAIREAIAVQAQYWSCLAGLLLSPLAQLRPLHSGLPPLHLPLDTAARDLRCFSMSSDLGAALLPTPPGSNAVVADGLTSPRLLPPAASPASARLMHAAATLGGPASELLSELHAAAANGGDLAAETADEAEPAGDAMQRSASQQLETQPGAQPDGSHDAAAGRPQPPRSQQLLLRVPLDTQAARKLQCERAAQECAVPKREHSSHPGSKRPAADAHQQPTHADAAHAAAGAAASRHQTNSAKRQRLFDEEHRQRHKQQRAAESKPRQDVLDRRRSDSLEDAAADGLYSSVRIDHLPQQHAADAEADSSDDEAGSMRDSHPMPPPASPASGSTPVSPVGGSHAIAGGHGHTRRTKLAFGEGQGRSERRWRLLHALHAASLKALKKRQANGGHQRRANHLDHSSHDGRHAAHFPHGPAGMERRHHCS